ncbi:LLM class F420-dependent oxidoreductase [Streptomyces sp. NPDC048172]|uniref:LLM class F420-dependent oxidoreductase n=1 Tax=Streptomyces sp. NPDC048172 TaxID=3365505 RepID=UPI0037148758
MKFGLLCVITDFSYDPVSLGQEAEERGFESLFVPEHTHMPARIETPRPDGGAVVPEALQGLDPFTALAAVAATTETLLIGTGICEVPVRDPLILAKQVASLDVLSQGRFLFGVGTGWVTEELLNHGVDPATRASRLVEHLEAMRAVWTRHEAAYAGRFVKFDPVVSLPKPVQRPHPPLLIGLTGRRALDRVLETGGEWMPMYSIEGAGLGERIDQLNARAADAGRPPVPVTAVEVPPEEEAVARCVEAGVSRCVFTLPPGEREDVLPLLDWYTELIEQADSL